MYCKDVFPIMPSGGDPWRRPQWIGYVCKIFNDVDVICSKTDFVPLVFLLLYVSVVDFISQTDCVLML